MEHLAYSTEYSLSHVVIILFAAIFVVVSFKKIKLSPVIGYIIAGAIIGPHCLKLVGYNDATKALAEFGVVFLLFSIGLEMTLERLRDMKKYILGCGLLQFLLTSVIFSAIIYLFMKNLYASIVIGTAFAISSTAIVLKILSEEKKTNSQLGKVSVSVLLFQDMAVIPIFIIIPLLGLSEINYSVLTATILIKSFLALAIIILAGRFLLRPIMHFIVSSKYDDIFIASTLLVVVSSAWITYKLGLSLGLGAFVAGVMIAETEFQHQIESITTQFKALFLGFFFMTEIGMHVDFSLISSHAFNIIFITIGLIIVKALIFFVILIALKVKKPLAINASLLISQSGEFAFIIFELARNGNILTSMEVQIVSVVVGLSMALTPILASIGKKLEKSLNKASDLNKNVNDIPDAADHVVIAGYGRIGSTVANVIQDVGMDYIAIDTNLKKVSENFKAKKPVYYGNITHPSLLKNLNIGEARAVVLAIADSSSLSKAAKMIIKNYPHVPLVIRTIDVDHYNSLKKLGAKIIIPEVYELGLQISNELLSLSGASDDEIHEIMNIQRTKLTTK